MGLGTARAATGFGCWTWGSSPGTGVGHTTTYTYDLARRRVAEEDPLGNVTHYQYDGHG